MTDVVPYDEGFRLRGELEQAGVLSETSIVLPPGIPYERYEALVAMWGDVYNQSRWVIGDLINYGEKNYESDIYAQAEAATQLSRQTLMNYASIARRIPRSARRRNLSITMHDAVASKPPPERDRLLRLAAESGWKREEFREHIRFEREQEEERAMQIANGDQDGRVFGDALLPPAVVTAATPTTVLCTCPTCGDEHEAR